MHYHIQKNEFSTKLSSEYEGYETLKQQIAQETLQRRAHIASKTQNNKTSF